MGAQNKFNEVFDDAVDDLVEYHPYLADAELVERIKMDIKEFYADTGNAQADYEHLRNNIEQEIKRVEFTDSLHN